MSKVIAFEKLHNARDLGGMPAADGRQIRPGLLYRTGHLSDLTESDAVRLESMVRTVVDFRTDAERLEAPDAVLPGVTAYHIPVVENMTGGISREEEADRRISEILLLKPAEAKNYMCELYRMFTGDFASAQYSRFLQILKDAEGGVLWHCTAGKDRAGIASVILEEILGVPREMIIDDYMRTNEYLAGDIRFLTQMIKKKSGTDSPLADEALRYLFGAEEDYIRSWYRAVEEKSGGIDNFLRDSLGVSDGLREEFREKYLVNCV